MSAAAGAPKRRRSKDNVTELKPGAASAPKTAKAEPAGDLETPPDWLSTEAKALWRAVVPILDDAYPETLSAIDVPALGLMLEHHAIARAAAESMRDEEGGLKVLEVDEAHRDRLRKSPASQVMRDHGKAFLELARDFGLTLRGRAGIDLEKLGGAVVPDHDPDDDLFED